MQLTNGCLPTAMALYDRYEAMAVRRLHPVGTILPHSALGNGTH